MATPVPYTGRIEDVPQYRPTPEVSISTPPQAFGVNIGQAVEHLGEVQQGAGKELFDRAFAMQELQEHANASNAITQAQNAMMKRTVDYNSTEGRAAFEGYNGFQSDLDAIKGGGRQGLSPYAGLLYDDAIRSENYRLKFNGAVHAKDEQKKYIVGTANASIASDTSMMQLDPSNEGLYEQNLAKIKGDAQHREEVLGLKPDDVLYQQGVKKDVSNFIIGRVRALADNGKYVEAQSLLNKAVGDKDVITTGTDMFGRNDIERVQAYVDEKRRTIGSRVETSKLMSGEGLQWGAKVVPTSTAMVGIKAIEGGSYTSMGPTITDKVGHKGNGLGAYQVMSYNLQGWLREAGMPAMSQDEFLHDRDAQDKLFEFKFGQYMQQYGSFNAAAVAWFGGPGAVGRDPTKIHDVNVDGQTYLRTANSAIAHSSTMGDRAKMARDRAAQVAPNDPEFGDAMESHAVTSAELDQRIQREQTFQNEQTLYGVLTKGDQTGKLPTSIAELTATPDAKAAYDQLIQEDPQKLQSVRRALMSNAKGDVYMDDARLADFSNLKAEAIFEPDKFVGEDILSKDLPMSAKKELLDMRLRVFQKADADPNISAALRIQAVQAKMQELGLTRDQDKANMYLFSTMLGDTMKGFIQQNGRPPKDAEVEEMTNRLLQDVGAGHMWSQTIPFFESSIPDNDQGKAFIAQAKALAQQGGGQEPTEQELNRWWIQMQYQNQYGKPGGPIKPSPVKGPQ